MDKDFHLKNIRFLENTYISNFTKKGVNSDETIQAFHVWYNAVLVLFKNYFSRDNEDFCWIKNQDVSGNGYILYDIYRIVSPRYNMMMDDIEKCSSDTKMKEKVVLVTKHEKPRNPKIFISHRSLDKPFVDKLITMLEFIVGNDSERIFCSSIAGYDIMPGSEILKELKRQFDEYDIFFIVVHSPRYYNSSICLNEMGAAWVLGTQFCSFLTPDCSFSMLNGAIDARYISIKVNDDNEIVTSKLNQLKDILIQKFGLEKEKFNQNRWETIRNSFISDTKHIDFTSFEEHVHNNASKPHANIVAEMIEGKPMVIDISNRGKGTAEKLNVKFDESCADMIISGLDNFPLEYLTAGKHVKLSVYPCISDPEKFKIYFTWNENGFDYSSEDILVL